MLPVYGGQPYAPQVSQLKRGVDIVVGTPGRLIDLLERKVLDLSEVKTVVIDEADEMLNMGFIECVEEILSATPMERQTALFTATMPARIRALANRFMRDPQFVSVKQATVTVRETEQRYYLVHESDKLNALTNLFEMEPMTSALIFARTRAETTQLASELSVRGFPAEALNGDLEQNARERILGRFRANTLKVLVATDVAARGLDIDDISHVINYQLPDDPEVYVHRIGQDGTRRQDGHRHVLLYAARKAPPARHRRLHQTETHAGETPHPGGYLQTPRGTGAGADEGLAGTRARQARTPDRGTTGGGRARRAGYRLGGTETGAGGRETTPGRDGRRGGGESLPAARTRLQPEPPQEHAARYSRNTGRHDTSDRVSHEAGMIRLKLNTGKYHGVRPNDVVGMIAYHADIPGNTIGKIRIEDKHTMVDIPEQFVDKVLAKQRRLPHRKAQVRTGKSVNVNWI